MGLVFYLILILWVNLVSDDEAATNGKKSELNMGRYGEAMWGCISTETNKPNDTKQRKKWC
jgi:hypothetical protein